MQVCVRPMEANLTHDTETFGRMVRLWLCSPPIAKFIWEGSTNEHSHVISVVKIHIGMIDYFLQFLLELIL